tara:strand:+ start:601 stop:741 length:141 start_codon:yes stop_codon:yes gene_type:complete
MPVYLRNFYYEELCATKKSEKKKMDEHNRKIKRPSIKSPRTSRFKR